jgi:hypothetical protein
VLAWASLEALPVLLPELAVVGAGAFVILILGAVAAGAGFSVETGFGVVGGWAEPELDGVEVLFEVVAGVEEPDAGPPSFARRRRRICSMVS